MTTHERDPADIEVILDEAKLDAVSGGEMIDGVARAVLGFRFNAAYVGWLSGEIIKEGGPCPLGPK